MKQYRVDTRQSKKSPPSPHPGAWHHLSLTAPVRGGRSGSQGGDLSLRHTETHHHTHTVLTLHTTQHTHYTPLQKQRTESRGGGRRRGHRAEEEGEDVEKKRTQRRGRRGAGRRGF